MKTSSTFSIMFWADFARAKNEQASIYARITVNGKRTTINLKQKVVLKDWDIHKNRARGTSQKSRILNSYLDETYNHIFTCYRDLMAHFVRPIHSNLRFLSKKPFLWLLFYRTTMKISKK